MEGGGGGGSSLNFRGVVKKRDSPDFRSPEVGISVFNKSEDHGNDVMVAQLICFSLSCVCEIFRETSMELEIKTVNVIVKNKLTTISKGYILMVRSHGP